MSSGAGMAEVFRSAAAMRSSVDGITRADATGSDPEGARVRAVEAALRFRLLGGAENERVVDDVCAWLRTAVVERSDLDALVVALTREETR